MALKVNIPRGWFPVYCKYERENYPQPAYICLDCANGELYADYDGNVGGGEPREVYEGHVQRWRISPYAAAEDLKNAMNEIREDCEIILDGYDTDWDGSNDVAVFTEEATEALERVEGYVDSIFNEDFYINEYDEGDPDGEDDEDEEYSDSDDEDEEDSDSDDEDEEDSDSDDDDETSDDAAPRL